MHHELSEEDILQRSGIRPSVSRLLVLRTLLHSERPLSLTEIEHILESVDKSQISRALTLFMEYDLLHRIEDGSGATRYEVCHDHNHGESDGGHKSHTDTHVHFYCERCGKLFCLEDEKIPAVNVPEGYIVRHSSYIISGICPNCHDGR